MENTFLQRKNEANYIILPVSVSNYIIESKIAVIIFLYYFDTLHLYFHYIDELVPEKHIDVILITSSDAVEEALRGRYRRQSVILKKQNRGRDMSALLVAARRYFLDHGYEYVCFVHDKKARSARDEADVRLWIKNLWDNTLASRPYIQNIAQYFELHKDCGLLVPPEPFGLFQTAWFGTSWRGDFQNTKNLAGRLGISSDIREDCPPVALGNAFWCRRKALEKLFLYPWAYEDFPEEPLPVDGTVSHAAERIFPYVAQDAGYTTKTVISSDFCPLLLAALQDAAFSATKILKRCLEVHNVYGLKVLHGIMESVPNYFFLKKKVYLFGAGRCGRACLHILRSMGLEPQGFVVSKEVPAPSIDGLPVFSFSALYPDIREAGIIITVFHQQFQSEIIRLLEEARMEDYILWHPESMADGAGMATSLGIGQEIGV